MQGFRLSRTMAEPLLTFANAEHRHMISVPTLARPWKKVKGPGIVGLNLDIYSGCVLGLVGPNGAGKTTLMRMMAGILPLQAGTVTARFSSTEAKHVDDLRQWVGHMPEQVRWQGVAVVISSHMVAQLDQLIDRIALLHRGQLLDEGNLEEVERRLNLSNRYRIQGKGAIDIASILSDIEHEHLDFEGDENEWSFVFRGQAEAVLHSLMASATVTSWSPVAPNLVELLCAATGMEVEDISLEVGSSAMLPMRVPEVEEDE